MLTTRQAARYLKDVESSDHTAHLCGFYIDDETLPQATQHFVDAAHADGIEGDEDELRRLAKDIFDTYYLDPNEDE